MKFNNYMETCWALTLRGQTALITYNFLIITLNVDKIWMENWQYAFMWIVNKIDEYLLKLKYLNDENSSLLR